MRTRRARVAGVSARIAALAVALALGVSGAALTSLSSSRVGAVVGNQQSAPGSPGVPAPGTPVFIEDFSSGAPKATATLTPSIQYNWTNPYTGGPDAYNAQYWADSAWYNGYCNGLILNVNSTNSPSPSCVTGSEAWKMLRAMSYVLGQVQGQTDPAANNAVTAMTNSGDQPANQSVQLRTTTLVAPVTPGHFYQGSFWSAAINCRIDLPGSSRFDPAEHVDLLLGASPTDANPTIKSLTPAAGVNPCTDAKSAVTVYPRNTAPLNLPSDVAVHTLHVQSDAWLMPDTARNLGIQLWNSESHGTGNDSAFDTAQIVDVTPQLDKAFAPAQISAGDLSTLTFTITNTTDLMAKNGWTFTDTLPADLRAIPGTGATTCSGAGSMPVISPPVPSGVQTITVPSGNLDQDATSCNVTVKVTSTVLGSYTNDEGNLTQTGLLPPGTGMPGQTLRVAPHVVACSLLYGLDQTASGPVYEISTIDAATGIAVPRASINTRALGFPAGVRLNGLGVDPAGGGRAWLATQPATGLPQVIVVDFATGGATVYPGPTALPAGAGAGLVTGGAYNPADGVYYFGGLGGGSSLHLYGFDTTASPPAMIGGGQPILEITRDQAIGSIDFSAVDVAFDMQGNLYIGMGSTLAVVPKAMLDAAGPAGTGQPMTATVITPAAATLDEVGALAFATDGSLLVQAAPDAPLVNVNPDSGALLGSVAMTNLDATASTSIGDFASCAAPSTVTVRKDLPGGRAASGDQFEVSVTGGGLANGNTGVTAGTSAGIQDDDASQFAGPVIALPGVAYRIAEAVAVGTSTDLALYTQSWRCMDASGNALVGSGSGSEGEFTLSANSAVAIECTITNALTTGIALDKVVAADGLTDVNSNGLIDAGDTIAYEFVVTNTGGDALSDITIDDPLLAQAGIAVSCPQTSLASLADMTCAADAGYVIPQSAVDAGKIVNIATVTGSPRSGTAVTASDEATTLTDSRPSIGLVKTVDTILLVAGRTITYTMTATNTGTVTLTDVTISEGSASDGQFTGTGPLAPLSCVQPATLLPGGALICTTTYEVTTDDIAAGWLTNPATATGFPPLGPAVSGAGVVTTAARPPVLLPALGGSGAGWYGPTGSLLLLGAALLLIPALRCAPTARHASSGR